MAWRSSHDRPVAYGTIGVDRASCAIYGPSEPEGSKKYQAKRSNGEESLTPEPSSSAATSERRLNGSRALIFWTVC